MSAPDDATVWGPPDSAVELIARNVSTRYIAIFVDGAIGLMLLPFNVSHLGPSAYGLWALMTAVTWYFGILDLGYGSALVKFSAQYRALRDRTALNEIVSTLFVVFAGIGALCFLVTVLVAWRVHWLFHLEHDQIRTAQLVLLTIGAYLSIQFPLSVFGAVVVGFQRYYRNNLVSVGTSVVAAVVNVAILSGGHGLVTLAVGVTAVRLLSLGIFVWNAYRAFPGLRVNPALFRRARLHEVTGFSVYMFVLDISAKLNYSSDNMVIGAMLGTTAVAIYTVGLRLSQMTQNLANQLNTALFPNVVDSDAARDVDRLQTIMVRGTKLSLALAAPLCLGLIALAEPLIQSWLGPRFSASVLPARILLLVVLVRISTASANLMLKGAGRHKLLTVVNVTTAAANVLLSIALVGPFGVTGVALGTLIPVSLSVCVIYPSACRRVGLRIMYPITHGIWPAMWPALIMVAVLALGRPWLPPRLIGVALHLGAGWLLYVALFLGFAIDAGERRDYWTRLRTMIARDRRVAAAI